LDFLTENLRELKYGKDKFIIENPLKFNIIARLIEKNKDKIIYLKEHGEIIDYIDKPCIMYNFDHHHDIYYQEESKEECHKMIEFGTKEYKLLESCWVYYLFISGYITKYKCFVNYNTHISTDVLQYGFEFYLNYYDEFNPYKQDLYNTNFDKVFVILSVDYIIKHYDKLYVTYPARDFKMISYYIKNNCREEYDEHIKDKFIEY